MRSLLWAFKWSIVATVAGLVAAWLYGGLAAVGVVAALIALEGSISFDNAIVNASVLRRMSDRWQRAFLTIGIVIAVFGMRIAFPILVVAVATKLGIGEVLELALTDQDAYAANVERATPAIGAFGGTFLLLVALDFLFDDERELHWIGPVERALARAGQLPMAPVAVVAVVLIALSQLVAADAERDVLLAGLVGLVTYLVVHGGAALMERRQGGGADGSATGAAGLAAFVYLETLDASFSLDGVLGAFAITKDVVLLGLGLGVGAIYVRSLTVVLVRRETLGRYRYLRHGAHWAIALLAAILYASIALHVPEALAAAAGLVTVAAALATSIASNRRDRLVDVEPR